MILNPNPFVWQQINLKFVYGRDEILIGLQQDLQGGRSTALIGGRKIGKTTVLRKLEHQINAIGPKAGFLLVAIYLDTLSLDYPLSQAQIYQGLLATLLDRLSEAKVFSPEQHFNLIGESRIPELGAYDCFRRVLKRIIEMSASSGFIQIAILVDEIEPIVKQHWATGFFNNWRHLISNEPQLSKRISVIFSGSKEMSYLARDVGSPIVNVLTTRDLTPLGWRACRELIFDGTRTKLSDKFIRGLYHLTGGHPFLVQILMHFVCQGDLDEAHKRLMKAPEWFLHNHGAQFANWWYDKFSVEERKIYMEIMGHRAGVHGGDIGGSSGAVANTALRTLRNFGVIKSSHSKNRHAYNGALFRQWVLGQRDVTHEPGNYDRAVFEKLANLDGDLATKYVSAWSILHNHLPNYSGAVSELRDVLTLALGILAPDAAVMAHDSFTFELDDQGKALTKPTRRQKAQFIARKKRGLVSKGVAEQVDLFESLTESLSACVVDGYGNASARTHKTATYDQAWRCLKQLDSLLAQLL